MSIKLSLSFHSFRTHTLSFFLSLTLYLTQHALYLVHDRWKWPRFNTSPNTLDISLAYRHTWQRMIRYALTGP